MTLTCIKNLYFYIFLDLFLIVFLSGKHTWLKKANLSSQNCNFKQFHQLIGTQRLKFLGLSALTTRSFISISVLFIILLFLVLDNCLWLYYTISQWLHHKSTLSAKIQAVSCIHVAAHHGFSGGNPLVVGHPVNSKSTRFTLTT